MFRLELLKINFGLKRLSEIKWAAILNPGLVLAVKSPPP